jgi:hypothetical protein
MSDNTTPVLPIEAKQAFKLAFEGIGGVPKLITWARSHRTLFYQAYAKLLAHQTPAALTQVNVNLHDRDDAASALRDAFARVLATRAKEDVSDHPIDCRCTACLWRRQNNPALSGQSEITKSTGPVDGTVAGISPVARTEPEP